MGKSMMAAELAEGHCLNLPTGLTGFWTSQQVGHGSIRKLHLSNTQDGDGATQCLCGSTRGGFERVF